jgi:hypothetical protein
MDSERVRAYLQVACAGLGFDIGEVWWTSNENGASSVAAIGTVLDPLFQQAELFLAHLHRCDMQCEPYV